MDGYALGKTKVFLKYFHLEYLSKLYEKQIRKIIRVQAVVRRWLASLKVRIIKKRYALKMQNQFKKLNNTGWFMGRDYKNKLSQIENIPINPNSLNIIRKPKKCRTNSR